MASKILYIIHDSLLLPLCCIAFYVRPASMLVLMNEGVLY